MTKSRVARIWLAVLLIGVMISPTVEAASTQRSAASRTVTIPARTCGVFDPPSCLSHDEVTVAVGAPTSLRGLQQVVPSACVEGALEGATCGRVEVPLERDAPNTPDEEMVSIYFELYTHSNDGPATGVILPNFGGPGGSTTEERGLAMTLFGANLDTHDLLLIDERGMGQSEAVDCPEMEGPRTTLEEVIATSDACLAVLGDAADDYSSGDIALDFKDVLDSLNYERADLFGLSYGGLKMLAFAARFPEMVRSVVLDSPLTQVGLDTTAFLAERVSAIVDLYVRYCERSKACSALIADPRQELLDLIQRIQTDPLTGHGIIGDLAESNRLEVTIDENALLELMLQPNFALTIPQLPAAAVSLEEGDRKPLLRIGAETKLARTFTFDLDPASFSIGAQFANACSDIDAPWNWGDEVPERLADYEASLISLPAGSFGPFDPRAADSMIVDIFGKPCIAWERPSTPTPVIPAGADFPDVPVMLLWGDLDFLVPRDVVAAAAEVFTGAQVFDIPEAGHTTVNPVEGGPCTIDDVNAYLDTVTLPPDVCEKRPLTHPGFGEFPLTRGDTSLSTVTVGDANEAGLRGRRSAVLAVRTLMDTLTRGPIAFGSGPCLRGGRYQTNFETFPPVMKVTGCKFARDLAINGRSTWFPLFFGGDGSLSASLDIRRQGETVGNIQINGRYWGTSYAPRLRLRGRVGGARVALSLPST